MLDKVFAEGAEEVEIAHPTEGSKIITRQQWTALKAQINKEQGSPAERMMRRKQYERAVDSALTQFMAQMKVAEVREINIEDGQFGVDASGKPVDVEGMDVAMISDYPAGIDLLPGEVGCLVHRTLDKPAIRLVATPPK